jgi:PAS domain S-box-containing protein
MALFIVVGWIFTGILGNIGLKYDRQRICSVMDVLREPIIAITRISDQLAETMSGSPNFAALSGPDQMTYLDKMDSTVDRYSRAIPGSICYILDKNGVTVTSSNRLEKDSFTGKNYGFRPYFRKAMNGEKSSYIAMGVTSKLPGYYSAAPVHGPGNEVIGAAVIKLDLGGELQKALAIGRFTVSLVHSSGYSIASSDGALAAKPLWPVEKKVWEDILASKQFPDFSGEPLLKAKPGNGDMFPVKKALTLFSVENSGIEGVMLVGMTPPDGYSIFRLAGIVVLLMILLIFSFLSIAAENKMSADIKMKEYDLKIETIAETAVDGLVMTDREGVILFWNRTAESMFGYSRREALGKDLFGLAVPDGSPELRRSVLPRSVENVRGMEKGMVTEIPCTRQNGEKFPAEMSFAAVESDGKWQAVGLIKDITERKKTEDALRESEKRFMDILYSSKDAILLIDGNAFVDCNDATAHMLKYPKREDFLMTHPSELSPPKQPDGRDSFEKANDMMRTALEKGFHRFEWTHKKAGGEVFPVEVSLTPITMKGRNILHCVWRDLTGAKLEEKEKKERMHELEVFYKASVEREERIIELKEELRKLREKLGCMGL